MRLATSVLYVSLVSAFGWGCKARNRESNVMAGHGGGGASPLTPAQTAHFQQRALQLKGMAEKIHEVRGGGHGEAGGGAGHAGGGTEGHAGGTEATGGAGAGHGANEVASEGAGHGESGQEIHVPEEGHEPKDPVAQAIENQKSALEAQLIAEFLAAYNGYVNSYVGVYLDMYARDQNRIKGVGNAAYSSMTKHMMNYVRQTRQCEAMVKQQLRRVRNDALSAEGKRSVYTRNIGNIFLWLTTKKGGDTCIEKVLLEREKAKTVGGGLGRGVRQLGMDPFLLKLKFTNTNTNSTRRGVTCPSTARGGAERFAAAAQQNGYFSFSDYPPLVQETLENNQTAEFEYQPVTLYQLYLLLTDVENSWNINADGLRGGKQDCPSDKLMEDYYKLSKRTEEEYATVTFTCADGVDCRQRKVDKPFFIVDSQTSSQIEKQFLGKMTGIFNDIDACIRSEDMLVPALEVAPAGDAPRSTLMQLVGATPGISTAVGGCFMQAEAMRQEVPKMAEGFMAELQVIEQLHRMVEPPRDPVAPENMKETPVLLY